MSIYVPCCMRTERDPKLGENCAGLISLKGFPAYAYKRYVLVQTTENKNGKALWIGLRLDFERYVHSKP